MRIRLVAFFVCVLAGFFHAFAEEPRQSLLEQRRQSLAVALRDAALVGGDEFFDKAFKKFGVTKPEELNKTIIVAFPRNGHLLPAALKIKKVNTEPSLWSDALIETEDEQGRSFSVSVLLNPESLLSVKCVIMSGAFARTAPYYPGEPKVGHYANSSYLDVTFCVNNSIIKISGAPAGEATPDWPKIFEPIAKEVAGVLLSSPVAEAKEAPEKFCARVTPDEGGYLMRFNYDKSIENCWVKCETSSGTVERLDFDQVKLSVPDGQAATVTLFAISPDGKTAYKAALEIPADAQQAARQGLPIKTEDEEWLESKEGQEYLRENGIVPPSEVEMRTLILSLPEPYITAAFQGCKLEKKEEEQCGLKSYARYWYRDPSRAAANIRFGRLILPASSQTFAYAVRDTTGMPPVAGRVLGTKNNEFLKGRFSYVEGYGITSFLDNVVIAVGVVSSDIIEANVNDVLVKQIKPVIEALDRMPPEAKADAAKLALTAAREKDGSFSISIKIDETIRDSYMVKLSASAGRPALNENGVIIYGVAEKGVEVNCFAISPDGKTAYKAALKIPNDVQQSDNGQPPLPPQNGTNGASNVHPDGTHPTGADNTAPPTTNAGGTSGTPNATDTGTSSQGGAEAAVAEARPFPWAIVIIVAIAALALGAITTLLLTRRKKA